MNARAPSVDQLLKGLGQWRGAEAWLVTGLNPGDVPHGTDDGIRWVNVEGERFNEEDIVWLRRSAVLNCVESVAGRTTWQEWPETCDRVEGPRPPDRIDEMRLQLTASNVHGPVYLYCAASSTGPAGPVGSPELRSFRPDDDPTPPTDATVKTPISEEEADDLVWLAALAAADHLPEHHSKA